MEEKVPDTFFSRPFFWKRSKILRVFKTSLAECGIVWGVSVQKFHIAQVNIARMLAPLEDPSMAGFVDQLARINALADGTPGFVWRLADESGGAATDIRAFEDERILVNMSVWESIEALYQFSYRGHHAGLLRDRGKWFEASSTRLALWWVPAGAVPSVDDAKRKLELLEAKGPTADAFTFRQQFPPPR